MKSGLPLVFESLTSWLFSSDENLATEGLFRIAGPERELAKLRDLVAQGKLSSIDWTNYSIHSPATLLKQFFRELPTPILTFEAYPQLIQVFSKDADPMEATSRIVQAIPPLNQAVMTGLCSNLVKLASHSTKNKMTLYNIALVFAPGILKPKEQVLPYALTHRPLIRCCSPRS
jgi:hypothetical protein